MSLGAPLCRHATYEIGIFAVAMEQPKMTTQTLAILSAMLDDPTRAWWGFEVMEAAKLKSGTVYPALARLERAGWLESRWEDVNPKDEGRPRRRLYNLTPIGERRAIEELDRHFAQLQARWRQRPRTTLRPGGQPA